MALKIFDTFNYLLIKANHFIELIILIWSEGFFINVLKVATSYHSNKLIHIYDTLESRWPDRLGTKHAVKCNANGLLSFPFTPFSWPPN